MGGFFGIEVGFHFRVDAHELLAVGQDALLKRGGPVRAADEAIGGQVVVVEQLEQLVAAGVVAHYGAQQGGSAQRLHVEGHVGGPAETVFGAVHVHDGHRGLGREPAGAAPHVGIDHYIAHNEHLEVVEIGEELGEGGRGRHGAKLGPARRGELL